MISDEIITETLDSMADSIDDSYKLDGKYRAYASERVKDAEYPTWAFDICVTTDKWSTVAVRRVYEKWEMLIEGGVVFTADEFCDLVEVMQGGLDTIVNVLKSCIKEGMLHDA